MVTAEPKSGREDLAKGKDVRFIFLVVVPLCRINICRVNVRALQRINSSQTASDTLDEFTSIQTINMPMAKQATPLIRGARGLVVGNMSVFSLSYSTCSGAIKPQSI